MAIHGLDSHLAISKTFKKILTPGIYGSFIYFADPAAGPPTLEAGAASSSSGACTW